MRRLFPVCLLLLLISVPAAQAGILLFEPFDYPNGSLVPFWSHHSGSETGELQVVSSRAYLTQTNSEDVNMLLAGQPYAATNNLVLYASFTINLFRLPSGNGAYFAHFKDNGTSIFRDRIFVTTNGVSPGFYRVGLANASNAPSAIINSNLSLNTDYRLVTRYVISNAVSSLWLNPSAETNAAITATDPIAPSSIVAFALREALATGDGMGSLYFDNLVIATTFVEVVNLSGPPAIVTAPQSQSVAENANVTFQVTATGAQPLAYQWRWHGTNLPGATLASLNLSSVTTNQAGPYDVVITNLVGATNSPVATLNVDPMLVPPILIAWPQNQVVNAGGNLTFNVGATGTQPLHYQWRFQGTNLPGATNSSLELSDLSPNQAGPYDVVVTNIAGVTNSPTATLTVMPAGTEPAIAYLTYNVKGNGASDWTTNAPQVRAIGRQVVYLNPDIITFNEIPLQLTYEMTNFIAAFRPGFYLASNSGSDGFIRSVILSRFPILSSQSYFAGNDGDLDAFGYTNSNFTRDLFEARIAVPGFPQTLHVFATHLKSGQGTDDSAKRAAEASAISNYFVNGFLITNSLHPYVLSGDLNEDIDDPPPSHPQSIQRLANPATGLQLTTPLNPYNGSPLTFSIQAVGGLSQRYDYILPNGLLLANMLSNQVFRTDLLPAPPPPLLANDDSTASDHLPVFMVFANPYAKPFRLTSIGRTNQSITLRWESVRGQPYRVEASSNLASWVTWANGLMATGNVFTWTTNSVGAQQYFRIQRLP